MFKLTPSKSRALSNLCTNAFAVFLASIIIPTIVGGFDFYKLPVLIFGIVLTLVSALWSLIFAEKGNL